MAQGPAWANAPYAIKRERVEDLLATKRPSPRNRPNWYARITALQHAELAMPEGPTRDRITAEIQAMFRARDVQLERSSVGHPAKMSADELASLDCEMRAPEVRGLTRAQTSHQRICFLDGKPLPPRRIYWCSDECAELWASNHAWTAASHTRLRVDAATCQRCGYQPRLVCNGRHELPGGRVIWGEQGVASKDVTMEARPPWPCPQHPHPAYRSALEDLGEGGTCGRCGSAWPCVAVTLSGREPDGRFHLTGHWQHLATRQMEVNHKVPRVGAGYHDGCHHHQDGLETLCHPCHVIVTTEQARERRRAAMPPPTHVQPGLLD